LIQVPDKVSRQRTRCRLDLRFIAAASAVLMIAACRTAPSKVATNRTPDAPVVVVAYNPTLTPGVCDACELDAEGKLEEALPLYQRRATATGTLADRLRYAKALMRAGQTAPAAKLFDDLLTEGQVMGGHDSRAAAAELNASALLEDGFPRSALQYAESASENGNNPITALLLIRSLSAAGEQARARNAIDELDRSSGQLPFGQRLELARWHALAHASSRVSERLLYAKQADATAELYRYSVLADFPMLARDWTRAAQYLAAAEKRAAPGLDHGRVAPEWRNTRRELLSVRMRRALCLFQMGNRREGLAEAELALTSDEEFVRSAAMLMLIEADLAQRDQAAALAKLQVLAGHDHRFTQPVALIEHALKSGAGRAEAMSALEAVLESEDHSADFISKPLFATLRRTIDEHS
jgi:tetratricopeptide (TPR) repeat protein